MQLLRKFIINGLIMSTTSLALRALGVAFNAFVSRKLGADGIGLFTLVMSVYGLAVTVAASGVNLATTRMCAEALGKNDRSGAAAALSHCLVYALVCGVSACAALYLGADLVASVWLGDERCTRSLKLLALSLPFIAASNVLHGYFTAVRKAIKSAACQIFEQLFKTALCVFLLLYAVPDGIEYACMALVGGGALAEFLSFMMALVLYLIEKRPHSEHIPKSEKKRLTRELFSITVPVAAAAYIRSALTTVEHILIPRGLSKNPLTAATALATYGTLCGMVMPVIMFPTALLYSFTGLLIPEFAEADAANNTARKHSMTSRALGLTVIFSVGCAAILSSFSAQLGSLIYNSTEAGIYIGVMAPLIPIMYLDHAIDAILKGVGEQVYCMKVNIADAALCTLMVYFLCPRIGIWGYIVTVYAAEIMNFILSLNRLSKISEIRLSVGARFIKPIICAIIATGLAHGITSLISSSGAASAVIGISAAAVLYTVLLKLSGTVSYEDILFARKSVRRNN